MTNNNITTLINNLNAVAMRPSNSESMTRGIMTLALDYVASAGLDNDTMKTVYTAIRKAANPSGHYYSSNGIAAGIEVLEALLKPAKDEKKVSLFSQAHALAKSIIQKGDDYRATFAACLKYIHAQLVPTVRLNRANLHNLVSTGSIFSVEFVKRTTGELRQMTCRMGVQKHLKGGKKAFSDKAKDLITVYDMENDGYRSIPVDGIQHLSINGQSFSFGGVA